MHEALGLTQHWKEDNEKGQDREETLAHAKR